MKISKYAIRTLLASIIITTVAAGNASAGTQYGSDYRNLNGFNYGGMYTNYDGAYNNNVFGGMFRRNVGYTDNYRMVGYRGNNLVGYTGTGCNDPRIARPNSGWSCGLVMAPVETTSTVVSSPRWLFF